MSDFDAPSTEFTPTLEPSRENGATVVCGRCGTSNPPDVQACGQCRSFLPSNQVARRTGIYARQHPPDVTQRAEELTAGLISDLGGASELTTLQSSYVQKLGDIDTSIRLLTHDIAVNGLLTPGGRVREVYDKLLAGLTAFDRYAQRLGMERKPKPVASLSEVLTDGDR
jgi:hypothetical protein